MGLRNHWLGCVILGGLFDMAFVFQGMQPFVQRVIESEGRDHRDFSIILRSEPVDRVGQALSQASRAPASVRGSIAAGALEWRDLLLTSLKVVESAISETYLELGLPAPEFRDVQLAPMVETVPASDTESGEPPWMAQPVEGRSVVFSNESEEATRRKRR